MLKARQRIGKYRILKRLASGPLADVYRAQDTIQKVKVALKIPKSDHNTGHEEFLHEVQVATRLRHPNILTVMNASYIDDKFVIAMELGDESLADRIERRISTARALDLATQALAAMAFAHSHKIIHCDIKPENYILFPGNQLKLADFGFAKVNLRTLKASGSGTIDYIAPEQAMGRPKFQSDVFSLGLVVYRLLSGRLPEWPFEWPLPGQDRLAARVRPEIIEVLKKAIQLDPKLRYPDAVHMHAAFVKAQSTARKQKRSRPANGRRRGSSWRKMQWREFQRQFKSQLETRHSCRRCEAPVSESMQCCPWCGFDNPSRGSESRMPSSCPRCERGVKNDWDYCAWCYGQGFIAESSRTYPDKRYSGCCDNKRCRGPLMPFMRYCPWCRKKVRRAWKLKSSRHSCKSCGWGIAREFWNYCAWCREPVRREQLNYVTTSKQIEEALILDGAAEPHSVDAGVAGGEACAYTCRDPYKDSENEDTVALLPYGPAAAVLVVADGAGGLPAGKRASLTAVTTLAASLQTAMDKTMLLRTAILNGIEAANDAVLALANGSATTMTVVTLEGRLARSYQIGDSEAIVIGQRGLVKLQTTAHSPTGFAVEAGFLEPREALHHEERHLVSNFIGTSDMRIDIGASVELDLRDTILLATDGLMDNVHVDEIIEIVRKGPLQNGVQHLVQLASDRMRAPVKDAPSKPDDLSLILFRKPSLK